MIRRIWMLAMLLVLGFAQNAEAKSINTLNICIAPGETRECYIYMNTARTNLVSFQIEVQLPAGLTLNADQCVLTSRVLDDEQLLFAGKVGTNTYRLVSTSFNNIPFTCPDEPLVKLSLTADETFKGGTVSLANMRFITSSCDNISFAADSFTVKANPKIRGDVDFNGMVNVTDAMFIVNYILDSRLLYSSALDVNGDGIIDVTDAMTVVEQILN